MISAWEGFIPGKWTEEINVRDFIQKNYTPYDGNKSFLSRASQKTLELWEKCKVLLKEEMGKNGVLDIDVNTVASITSHSPGYIDKKNEIIVGLQTDAPLKRALNTFGGIRMAEQAANSYGYSINESIKEIFTKYRTTHNEGVYRAYTEEMLSARRAGIITGLPDAYGRGRIIGDYRRPALYGVDRLIEEKRNDLKRLTGPITIELIKIREEISFQIDALEDLKEMAASYGFDISHCSKCL